MRLLLHRATHIPHLGLKGLLHSGDFQDRDSQDSPQCRREEQPGPAGHAEPGGDPDGARRGQSPHVAIDIVRALPSAEALLCGCRDDLVDAMATPEVSWARGIFYDRGSENREKRKRRTSRLSGTYYLYCCYSYPSSSSSSSHCCCYILPLYKERFNAKNIDTLAVRRGSDAAVDRFHTHY